MTYRLLLRISQKRNKTRMCIFTAWLWKVRTGNTQKSPNQKLHPQSMVPTVQKRKVIHYWHPCPAARGGREREHEVTTRDTETSRYRTACTGPSEEGQPSKTDRRMPLGQGIEHPGAGQHREVLEMPCASSRIWPVTTRNAPQKHWTAQLSWWESARYTRDSAIHLWELRFSSPR